MSLRGRTRLSIVVVCTMIMAFLVASPASAGGRRGDVKITTIAEGFVGPLGLAVDRRGTAYVVDAFTGELVRVGRGGARTTLYTATDGGLPGGVAVHDRARVLFTKFTADDPEGPPTDTTLEVLRGRDRSRTIASLLEYEQRRNPDAGNTYGFVGLDEECLAQLPEELGPQPYQGIIESNPYAVTAHRGAAIVADAAGNSIVRVSPSGHISTIAVLPPVPQEVPAEVAEEFGLPECAVGETYHSEPVPTDVEVGPDGNLYVTSLPGVPEALGAGSVWRINPRSGQLRQVASGFLGAVDLAVGHDGTIYVADLFAGSISAVRRGEVRTVAEVPSPAAIETGPRGTLYATVDVFGEEGPTGNARLVKINLTRHRR